MCAQPSIKALQSAASSHLQINGENYCLISMHTFHAIGGKIHPIDLGLGDRKKRNSSKT